MKRIRRGVLMSAGWCCAMAATAWCATPGETGVQADIGAGGVVGERSPVNARVALNQPLTEVKADNVGLSHVMDYLRQISGVNLVVNWKVLEGAGVDRDAPISLDLHGVTLRKALQLVLDQASPTAPLVFDVDGNVIEVTSQDEADKTMVTRIYVVDDLVMPDNGGNVQPPTLNLQQATSGQNGSGGGQSIFSNSSNMNSQTAQNSGAALSAQKGADLVALVQAVVRPSIWRVNGGPASIRYFDGKLIVTAPRSVQEAIGGPAPSEGGAVRFGM